MLSSCPICFHFSFHLTIFFLFCFRFLFKLLSLFANLSMAVHLCSPSHNPVNPSEVMWFYLTCVLVSLASDRQGYTYSRHFVKWTGPSGWKWLIIYKSDWCMVLHAIILSCTQAVYCMLTSFFRVRLCPVCWILSLYLLFLQHLILFKRELQCHTNFIFSP